MFSQYLGINLCLCTWCEEAEGYSGNEYSFGLRKAWVQVQTQLRAKLLRLNKIIQVNHLVQCLTHHKFTVSTSFFFFKSFSTILDCSHVSPTQILSSLWKETHDPSLQLQSLAQCLTDSKYPYMLIQQVERTENLQ